MEENGFTVVYEDIQNLATVKARNHVPRELQSCHTAIVDGYIVEGHVPVREIERLLEQSPQILGLAVPGMPAGAPGMETGSGAVEPFDVIAFDEDGGRSIYASYP